MDQKNELERIMLGDLQSDWVLSKEKAAQMAPLTLAYIGDSVFDLYVRARYALCSAKNAGKLHAMSIRLVNARSQAAFAHQWMDAFTQEEMEIFLRGRNAKSSTSPKNMSIADYRYATAMEAVIGYLYLTGQGARVAEILDTLPFEL